MTAIVGIAHGGRVWIGGDSAGVSGFSLTKRADVKVFAKGGAVLGFTGSFRGGQLLRSSAFTVPDRTGGDVYDYMVTRFVGAVRDLFKAQGHAVRKDEEESASTGFLVGLDGRLFCVESDYQVGESITGYETMGCGRDVAVGSLHTSAVFASLTTPGFRVLAALRAASDHNCGVCPPFTVLSTVACTPGIFGERS